MKWIWPLAVLWCVSGCAGMASRGQPVGRSVPVASSGAVGVQKGGMAGVSSRKHEEVVGPVSLPPDPAVEPEEDENQALSDQPVSRARVMKLTAQAEKGDADAQWRLGTVYLYGRAAADGVPQDWYKAVYWLRKSALQGHPIGQHRLGMAYGNDGGAGPGMDDDAAFYWLTRSAEQGYYYAQAYLGDMYMDWSYKIDMPKNARRIVAYKWQYLAYLNAPEGFIKRLANDFCKDQSRIMSKGEVAEAKRLAGLFRPKRDAEAKAIADALVPAGRRGENVKRKTVSVQKRNWSQNGKYAVPPVQSLTQEMIVRNARERYPNDFRLQQQYVAVMNEMLQEDQLNFEMEQERVIGELLEAARGGGAINYRDPRLSLENQMRLKALEIQRSGGASKRSGRRLLEKEI